MDRVDQPEDDPHTRRTASAPKAAPDATGGDSFSDSAPSQTRAVSLAPRGPRADTSSRDVQGIGAAIAVVALRQPGVDFRAALQELVRLMARVTAAEHCQSDTADSSCAQVSRTEDHQT